MSFLKRSLITFGKKQQQIRLLSTSQLLKNDTLFVHGKDSDVENFKFTTKNLKKPKPIQLQSIGWLPISKVEECDHMNAPMVQMNNEHSRYGKVKTNFGHNYKLNLGNRFCKSNNFITLSRRYLHEKKDKKSLVRKPICKLSISEASKLLGVDISSLTLLHNLHPIEKLVKSNLKFNNETKIMIYDLLVEICNRTRFFGLPPKEITVNQLMKIVLVLIVKEIEKELDLPTYSIDVISEVTSNDEDGNSYRIDEIINHRFTGLEKHLLVLEYKRGEIMKGMPQLLFELKNAKKFNNENLPVYGVLTDAVDFKFIKYDNDQFLFFRRVRGLMSENMINRSEWLESDSLIIDLIYNLLRESLEHTKK